MKRQVWIDDATQVVVPRGDFELLIACAGTDFFSDESYDTVERMRLLASAPPAAQDNNGTPSTEGAKGATHLDADVANQPSHPSQPAGHSAEVVEYALGHATVMSDPLYGVLADEVRRLRAIVGEGK